MKAERPSDGAIRIATYDGLDRYVRAFAAGKFNLIVLVGAPGLQKSRVVIIANAWKSLNVHVTALEDRGHLLHFEPSVLEVHARTASWFWDQEIFDWIAAGLHLIERPSMRIYRAAWELKEAGMDWRGQLLERWLSGTRLRVARLQADPSFATEEDRVKAFVEQGGGCRATYFNHARRLKPPLEVPKIGLANSAPPQDDPFDLMDLLRQRHGGLGRG